MWDNSRSATVLEAPTAPLTTPHEHRRLGGMADPKSILTRVGDRFGKLVLVKQVAETPRRRWAKRGFSSETAVSFP